MGSRMFLLLVLVLLILIDHSQGVPETHDRSLIVSTFTDASAVGEALATPNPIKTPKQLNRPCNCKGKEREMVDTQCLCQKSTRRKPGNWRQLCQKRKIKNRGKCSQFSKLEKYGNARRIKRPSVPI
eukprot:superscaffoldBa00002006_g12828